jgi:hypothetical protein
MAAIVVVGATGVTGRRLVAALGDAGHEVIPARAEGDDPGAAVRAADLVVAAARDPLTRGEWLEAAVRHGVHALDAGADPGVAQRVVDDLGAPALAAGVSVVPAAGAAVGDLLVATAAGAVRSPAEVHVCWAFPDRGGWRRALAPGFRATAADRLAAPMPVVLDGRREQERAGDTRRLAWFPKPIGPTHAAGVPGPEPVTAAVHLSGVVTVRSYLALPTWRAELLQATAGLLRSGRWRDTVGRRLEQGDEPDTGLHAPRWACVAESRGVDGVARAWAYGRDPVGLGVAGLVALADVVLEDRAGPGVLPASMVDTPARLLDRLSVVVGLRWSVARPAGGGSGGDAHAG